MREWHPMTSYFDSDRTIAAIATPPGEGGIAIIRISGKEALHVGNRIFSRNLLLLKSHTLHFGKILDQGEVIDEGMVAVMRAPRSYTGEETVEIHCHGGSLVSRKVLGAALRAGATAAGPGEFTFQAVRNGKLDLAQAEAVQSLIGARNDLALSAAQEQLEGKVSEKVRAFQAELIDVAAILEAWVDFPEEGLAFASQEEIIASLSATKERIDAFALTFLEGRKVHEGISICLAGSPNAGKSSLMNALLGIDRAIVTEVPGTTRDLLDAELRLGQLHFRLTDTAGIRHTEEIVEKEGIRRSKEAIRRSDLVLLVIDASISLSEETLALLHSAPPEKTLLIWNKVDLPHEISPLSHPHQLSLSAKTGRGLDLLKGKIEEIVWNGSPPEKGEILLTQVRHKEALEEASGCITAIIEGLKESLSPEFLSADMRGCLKALGRIIGTDISEDILSAIFAKFCVGK